jgi:2-dehydro-3-deoxy-D-arabinonate dehydratase
MILSRFSTQAGRRWALDGVFLPPSLTLSALLELPQAAMLRLLDNLLGEGVSDGSANDTLSAPIDPHQEVWAAGVTYQHSLAARRLESQAGDVYGRVYQAERPEIFFKSIGWRVVGHQAAIRIRPDSAWNVPEPELVLVVNRHRETVGYCVGNDVSSRTIEGENPLYLPQAKIYDGACALGPGIRLCGSEELTSLFIRMQVQRGAETVFAGETTTALMQRSYGELVGYLTRSLDFPQGVFLMTGTGLVPGDDFSLQPQDVVLIQVGQLALENRVLAAGNE